MVSNRQNCVSVLTPQVRLFAYGHGLNLAGCSAANMWDRVLPGCALSQHMDYYTVRCVPVWCQPDRAPPFAALMVSMWLCSQDSTMWASVERSGPSGTMRTDFLAWSFPSATCLTVPFCWSTLAVYCKVSALCGRAQCLNPCRVVMIDRQVSRQSRSTVPVLGHATTSMRLDLAYPSPPDRRDPRFMLGPCIVP